MGASIEYGNVQGAVVDVITKSGSNRFLYDAAYFWQPPALTSQPMRIKYRLDQAAGQRLRTFGVPRLHDQPRRTGRSRSVVVLLRIPACPRCRQPARHRSGPSEEVRAGQDVREAHLRIWPRAGGWCKAFTTSSGPILKRRRRTSRATRRRPSRRQCRRFNFGHLTHTFSANTVWDLRVGAFRFYAGHLADLGRSNDSQRHRTVRQLLDWRPSANRQGPAASHDGEGDAQPLSGCVARRRSRVENRRAGRSWRASRGQFILPTGVSYAYTKGVLSRTTFQQPNNSGGRFVTAAAFVSDALRVGSRVTINPGIRFDHSRAISHGRCPSSTPSCRRPG